MCIWKNKPIEILDVPEDKPIVAYKFLKKSYYYTSGFDSGVFCSPFRPATIWKLGSKVSSKTRNPLSAANGVRVGIFAYATKHAAECQASYSHDVFNRSVIAKVHLWGKVAVQAPEPYHPYPTFHRKDMRLKRQRTTDGSRFKGYRAQHAKLIKVY